MAQSLLLNSLEIRNFRAFRHLRVERLGRINLIVGKNNVGKTSLLEAISLYSYGSQPDIVNQQLELRDEMSRPDRDRPSPESVNRRLLALRHLFFGRKNIAERDEPIVIGAVNDQDKVVMIRAGWYTEEKGSGRDGEQLRPLKSDEYSGLKARIPALVTARGAKPPVYFRLDEGFSVVHFWRDIVNCQSVRSSGLSNEEINVLWDQISLTEKEDDVLKALRIIAPQVERVSLVGDPNGMERVPIVKLAGQSGPLPMRSLGEGMNRLFGIALALANAKEGFLLIDEIENGLHHSVQIAVWRLIFEIAQRLNVQVFATTHSDDCVRAFQHVSSQHTEEGLLISLREKKDGSGDIVAVLYDESKLGIATQEQIEVR